MSYNKLAEIDEARLVGPVILLTPAGADSDQAGTKQTGATTMKFRKVI
jgi:hypothetical protein